MSDLESLGLIAEYARDPKNVARSALIRAALAGRRVEPGSAVVLPIRHPGGRDVLNVTFHAYGLVGEYMVALMLFPPGRLEVLAHSDTAVQTLQTFDDTPEGRREADACGAGAVAALSLLHGGLPPPCPRGPGGGGPPRIRRTRLVA